MSQGMMNDEFGMMNGAPFTSVTISNPDSYRYKYEVLQILKYSCTQVFEYSSILYFSASSPRDPSEPAALQIPRATRRIFAQPLLPQPKTLSYPGKD